MAKYSPLQEYLQEAEKEGKTKIELTFDEIEENILGFTLPLAAYTYQSWWANGVKATLPQQRAWVDAGWKVESPTKTIDEKKATFLIQKEKKLEAFAYFGFSKHRLPDENQLKIAYWEMIKKYHPDRFSDLGNEFIELAKKKTKEISDMYQKALTHLKHK